MASVEIAEASDLIRGLNGGGDDAFENATHLSFEGDSHGVGSFSNGDDEEAVVGVEIVEVFSDAKDAAMTVDVAGESAFDGGVGESGGENVAGGFAHVAEFALASGRKVEHEGVRNAGI
jgi:hypothetical protein